MANRLISLVLGQGRIRMGTRFSWGVQFEGNTYPGFKPLRTLHADDTNCSFPSDRRYLTIRCDFPSGPLYSSITRCVIMPRVS